MIQRFIPALLLLLVAGCATTGQGTGDAISAVPEPADDLLAEQSSVATIDEHLFVPELEPLPSSPADEHVHAGVYERLTHSFALPECADKDVNQIGRAHV